MPEDELEQPVGKLKRVYTNEVSGNEQPTGKLKSVGAVQSPLITDFSATDIDNTDKVESAIDFLAKDPTTKGGLIDVDKDILRGVMSNPNASQDQIKESIATMQSGNLYYLKDENGIMVPKQLKPGERPPKGYDVQSVWGTQKDANDDSWYTDLGKSLGNGIVKGLKGVGEVAQLGVLGATGKESETLGRGINALEALQTQKDESLDAPLFNVQGVNEWADLVDKDRFDVSPKALWGTLNMAAESITSFLVGAKMGSTVIKGGKALRQGLQGLDEAVTLGKGGASAAAFTGSFLTQLGDNLENAKEAGLEGREAAAFASLTTSAQASIDAAFGLEAQIFRNLVRRPANELMRDLARTVERDADGRITEVGLRTLAANTTTEYGKLATSIAKEIGKGALREGAQETAQDAIAKGAENLWDKMNINERNKFGTDAASPEAFASYIQNGLAGIVSGGAMGGLAVKQAKKKYDEQSINALGIIQQGPEAEAELRGNLQVAKDKGSLSPQEYDQAIFKLDAYKKYNEQTADLNLSEEQKKKTFELSFNIEALNHEINSIPKEELENLDPIGKAKINSKKKLMGDLQKELDDIILREDVQKETLVGQDTVDKVAKNEEPKEEQTKLSELLNQLGQTAPKPTEKVTLGEDESANEDVVDFEVDNIKSMTRRPIEKFTTAGWNKMAETNPQRVKAIVQERLKNEPNNEMDVVVRSGKNRTLTFDIGENKQVKSSSSEGGEKAFFKHKNLPAKRIEVLDKGGSPVLDEKGESEFYYEEPVTMKRLDFESKDKEGKPMNKAVVAVYNKKTGEFISFIREHRTGKSSYTTADKYHLAKIYNSNLNDKGLLDKYSYKPKVEKTESAAKEVTKKEEKAKDVNPEQEKVNQINQAFETISESAKNAGLDTIIDKISKGKEVVFTKPASIEAAQKNDLYNVEIQKDGSAKVIGVYNPETKKWVGKEKTKEAKKEEKKPEPKKEVEKPVSKESLLKKIQDYKFSDGNTVKDLIGNNYDNGSLGIIENFKIAELNTLIDEFKNYKTSAKTKTEPVQKPSNEIKVEGIEITKGERETLLDKGYDNAAINKAVAEANRLRKLPAKELFKNLLNKGVFNLGTGDTYVERPDVGLASEVYNNTLSQLEKNKDTKTIEKLMNFVEDIKETGIVKTIRGTGGKTQRFAAPLHRSLLENSHPERGLTETEENEELSKKEAQEQYEAQLQKKSDRKGDITKIVERIKKSFPKVKVVYDDKLDSAAQVQGNTITINPGYAGLDTPIHEAGHILIDAIGFKNKVIQAAIKQLQGTKLWSETKERYPELSDEMLAKEVLAEAIGREGANIFDSKAKQNRFMEILDYIFTKLKQLLGVDRNVAKSLAKQVLSGIGTANLEGTNTEVQKQKNSYSDAQIKKEVKKISAEKDLSAIPIDKLVSVYNAVMASGFTQNKKSKMVQDLMTRIALHIKQLGLNESAKPVDEDAIQKDITWIDKWFKVLSHFSDAFPDLKYFSKIWNSAYFNKMKEAKAEKRTHDKLAEAVIKDRNSKLGIVDNTKRKIAQLISENSHRYFGFLDNGKGELVTLEEAQKKGFSKAQIDYLKYVRETLGARKELAEDEDIYNVNMDVLKLDKGVSEAFQTEGVVSAIASWIGTNSLSNIKLTFTNPNTGKTEPTDFIDIQNSLIKYSEKGLKEKIEAVKSLVKYTMKARKKRVSKAGDFTVDENGKLQSRFTRSRDARKSYSKDFYSAVNQYIDDSAHIKHISPLVPVINSIEKLNRMGLIRDGEVLHDKKQNVTEWIEKWQKLHILQQTEETQSDIDKVLRVLRFLTSGITMWFNVPANILNIAIGNYNNWRQENSATWAKGQQRLFGGTDRKVTKEYGYGVLNRYAADIVRKYSGVSNDRDSNPLQTGKGILAQLGFLGQAWGEFQIQGSGLLGLMEDKDYNSFEYKKNKFGVEELVVKDGVNEKELEARILANIDKVSDVQGKYSEKDRRNIQNNEMGKIAMQFKQWMPDAFRVRYGSEGSWNKQILQGGFSELRKQMKDKGIWNTLNSDKPSEEAKDFMRNLKGLMATGLLMALVYRDDEDKKKSQTSKMFERALSDVLFIFDPNNLKFTITKPVAAIGTIEKMINIGDHIFAFEADDYYKADSKYGEKGDSKLRGDVMGLVPGKKVVEMLNDEE